MNALAEQRRERLERLKVAGLIRDWQWTRGVAGARGSFTVIHLDGQPETVDGSRFSAWCDGFERAMRVTRTPDSAV